MAVELDKLPKFSELPIKPDAPGQSSWGLFGEADGVGCLNFLTPGGVVEAARLVKKGKVFRLDTRINYAEPPLFARAPAKHTIISFEKYGVCGCDDKLDDYNTQQGSQWDSLGHMGHPRLQRFYNGVPMDEVKSGRARVGIDQWANRVVGKGLLVDLFAHRIRRGAPIDPLSDERYGFDELTAALAEQAGEITPGTVLLMRTGWMQAYLAAPPEKKAALAPLHGLRACGIEPSSRLMEWLWDNRVAAIASDGPSVEPWPWDFADEGALHYRALALLGLPLGEQFDLEELAADCAADGAYPFMFVSAPLYLRGGIASPPNAVAIK